MLTAKEFGLKLSKMRFSMRDERGKRYTLEKLSSKIGCSINTLAGWESGTRYPTLPYIVSIADVFGCSIDDLVGRETNGNV